MITRSSSQSLATFVALFLTLFASQAFSHVVITYPGWRGNNLYTTGRTADDTIPPGSLGATLNKTSGQIEYPYGMQWMYPCGGLPTSTNRTKWPISGGAVSFQPGWFAGHATAFIYINMGLGTEPLNMSHPVVPVFQLKGPTNSMYPGTWCMPQVPLPANISAKVGDNATIQIIETAVHGAALYSCADITFADDHDPEIPNVNATNCFNSTGGDQGGPMGFNYVYTATGQTATNGAAATLARLPVGWAVLASSLVAGLMAGGLL